MEHSNDVGFKFFEPVVAETHIRHDAGFEIFNNHIDLLNKLGDEGHAAWIAQVDTQAFLAAIVLDVKQAALVAKDGGVAAQITIGGRF